MKFTTGQTITTGQTNPDYMTATVSEVHTASTDGEAGYTVLYTNGSTGWFPEYALIEANGGPSPLTPEQRAIVQAWRATAPLQFISFDDGEASYTVRRPDGWLIGYVTHDTAGRYFVQTYRRGSDASGYATATSIADVAQAIEDFNA